MFVFSVERVVSHMRGRASNENSNVWNFLKLEVNAKTGQALPHSYFSL